MYRDNIINMSPKFSNGDIVMYNSTERQKFLSYIKENNQTCYNQPLGKLRICSTPVWSERHEEWMYYYEYGLGYTSDGMTIQSKLEKVKK